MKKIVLLLTLAYLAISCDSDDRKFSSNNFPKEIKIQRYNTTDGTWIDNNERITLTYKGKGLASIKTRTLYTKRKVDFIYYQDKIIRTIAVDTSLTLIASSTITDYNYKDNKLVKSYSKTYNKDKTLISENIKNYIHQSNGSVKFENITKNLDLMTNQFVEKVQTGNLAITNGNLNNEKKINDDSTYEYTYYDKANPFRTITGADRLINGIEVDIDSGFLVTNNINSIKSIKAVNSMGTLIGQYDFNNTYNGFGLSESISIYNSQNSSKYTFLY